jgi:hypothetical protein
VADDADETALPILPILDVPASPDRDAGRQKVAINEKWY